jgi:hypothetical protein
MTDVIFATHHNSAQFQRNSALKMNKLSLVGMQLPEKYKENFDVSSEGPSSGVTSGGRENYMSFHTKNIKAIT